ncbi:MAG: twin-arginine translocation signal domain-containing protein [Candidatus Brocadiia bacterium]
MGHRPSRRDFLKTGATLGAAAAAARAAEGRDADQPMPAIELGSLRVSRLILGSNPFFGFAHQPGDLGKRMRDYYTEDRIMAVLDQAADHGITAVWTPCYERWIRLWKRYQDRGGKLGVWIGQPEPSPEHMEAHIDACARNGGKAICIQGVRIDQQFRKGRYEVVRGWLERVKSHGLPAGMATHRPQTHLTAEEKGLPTDFYHQCLYQPENYAPRCRQQALATVAKLAKPVVAYKVLAAGRLDPAKALPHVFARLRRKDGICVGVFPKDDPDQVAQDAGLVRQLTA